MNKQLVIATILLLGITSCDRGRLKIVDFYYVYDYADFDYDENRVKAENVLMCKLSSKNDPFIPNVKRVKWNESAIVALTDNGYFVIESNSYGLCCSCGNKTKGPLTENEIQQYITETNFEPENEERIK